ncbi:MAG TPA: hypothetical protein VF848_06055, partial [Steroidobacteraceae bacterium]
LADGAIYARLEKLGATLERALAAVPGLRLQRAGSLFWLCLSAEPPAAGPIRTPAAVPKDAGSQFTSIFHPLLERGIYLAPSAFEVGFLSTAHTEEHVAALAGQLKLLR